MLKQLSIHNYALINSLEIGFGEGLVIVTGETGAGKSILLGALQLLLGGKAEQSAIRDKGANCVVEALFEFAEPVTVNWQDSTSTEEKELLIRRVVNPTGRSRAFINDEPVSLQILSDTASKLVDIHTQHQHLLLCNSTFQMNVLDHFSGDSKELEAYRRSNVEYRRCAKDLELLKERIAKSQSEYEYKSYLLEKLSEAKLSVGELAEIEQEQKQLANAEEIKSALYNAQGLMESENLSIVRNLKEAEVLLSRFAEIMPELEELSQRVSGCRIECKDIVDEIESACEKIEVNPKRLSAVEERIGELYDLMHKHNCKSEEELVAYKENLEAELSENEQSLDELPLLEKRAEELHRRRAAAAKVLGEIRRASCARLSEEIEGIVRPLGMPKAQFSVELEDSGEYGEDGCERIKFLFSANEGKSPEELSKVASGGELSRIMLSLKAMLARYTGMPTLIFDEIDTGVSGGIADKMGRLIDELGKRIQVIAITHLPQIASKGDAHLLVYKENGSNGVETCIKSLSESERTMEIARMLSGEELSGAAIENAEYLLGKRKQ